MSKQIQMPEHKELVSKVLELQVGTTLYHDTIAEIMYLSKGSNRYRSQIKAANLALLQHNKQLVSVWGEGYRIIGADGMVNLALRMMEKSESRSKEAVNIIESINKDNLLSEETKMKYDLIVMKIVSMYASLSGGLVEARLIQRKNKVLNTT